MNKYILQEEAGDDGKSGAGDDGGSSNAAGTGNGSDGSDGKNADANNNGSGDGGSGDGSGNSFYNSLPDDWRVQIGGEDEARLNDLNRYTTLDKWVESGFEAKDKIRKGEVSTGLPDKPTDEQLVAYRAANGVPETSEYQLSLEPGVELSDMEKEIMTGVMGVAHQSNISTANLSALTGAWLQGKEAQLQRISDQDGLDKQDSEKTMRENWGVDFDKNMGAAVSILNGISEEDRGRLMEARDGNGRYLMSSPYFVQFLADAALKINPMANLPGGGNDPQGTADMIIDKVKKIFDEGKENTDYYKDQKLQDQYQQAIAAKQQAGVKI